MLETFVQYPSAISEMCVYICLFPLGFQIVGGENSGRMDLGTIISSITPGGPADVNGCLKPGTPLSASHFFLFLKLGYSIFS